MFPSTVLYFPSIEFQNEDFLKRSLLYWDRVLRIVPVDYIPNDSDFVKELRDNGLVKDISVSWETLQIVSEKFIDTVNSSQRAAGLSLQSYDMGSLENNMGRLHRSKIYFVLQDIFRDMGYNFDQDDFMHVPSQLAVYYMLVLALEIAKKRRIPLATDYAEVWSITPSFTENNNFAEIPSDTDGINCLTSMTVDRILPSDVSNIDARRLISISRDSRDARKSLRQHIGELIDRIQPIQSPEQAYDELNNLILDIEDDKAEYRRSQGFWNSEELTSCLNVSIPTMATLFSLNPGSTPMMIGSILFSFIQYFRNCHLIKKRRSASYQAYLVGLERQTSRSVIARIGQRLNEFIYD